MTRKAFRYRFYPSPDQEQLLRRTFGCVRLVYNKALALRSGAWSAEKRTIKYKELDATLTVWKRNPDLSFLSEVSCVPLQQALRHLDGSYSRFFKRLGRYPRFKKRRHGGSATFTRSAFTFRNSQLKLAKMAEPLDIRWSRPLPEGAIPSTVTVSLDAAGRWHVSMLCQAEVPKLPELDNAVGIDLGLTTLATLSTGEKVPNPRHDDLARRQRLSKEVSRKQKGSKNREKARRRLARLQARIADRRHDTMHKLSTRLVRENQTIVVEDLNVSGMVKNRKLARSISDAGWSMLVGFLAYKCEWYGRTFVKVDRFFPSSKLCSACGHKAEAMPLAVREWECTSCGAVHDRDENAALNILAAGLAVTACGPGVSHEVLRNSVQSGMKQEGSRRELGIPVL